MSSIMNQFVATHGEDTLRTENKALKTANKKLKEDLKTSEKERGQMAGNGGFCGDPETSQCANAMFWRMGRDRIKMLEEVNEELKERAEDTFQQIADALCGEGDEADSLAGWGQEDKLIRKAKELKKEVTELKEQ